MNYRARHSYRILANISARRIPYRLVKIHRYGRG
nr:MAG TPA_asm: hypothetical protein [Caudoviricetes sp.]